MYGGASGLGGYICIIVVSCSWIKPLIMMWCPSLSVIMVSILKPILSGMNVAARTFFCFQFAWNIFFQPLTFSLYVSLGLRLFSCEQHI